MPQIMIKNRADREGPVRLTLQGIKRILPRNEQVNVTDSELEVLMHSHESNYVFVYPEVEDGSVDRSEWTDSDQGGNEAGARESRLIG